MTRVVCILLLPFIAMAATAQTPEELEFFEQKLRPLLAENCYACHSSQTMAAADLLLDTGPGVLAGGSRGPAISLGDPAASLLIDAVSYANLDLQMPPAGKLSDTQIADLSKWIELGAPDPRQASTTAVSADSGIDFEFSSTFEVFLVEELVALGRIEVQKPEAEISAADLGEMLTRLRDQRKSFVSVDRGV